MTTSKILIAARPVWASVSFANGWEDHYLMLRTFTSGLHPSNLWLTLQRALKARADAIEEIMENNSYHMEKLRSLLINMPDLVRGLTRVQYGKATPNELATLLITLVRLASEFKPNMGNVFRSHLLNNIPNTLPTILDTSQRFLNALNLKQARENDVANLWADPDRFPDIQDVKDVGNQPAFGGIILHSLTFINSV